MHGGAGSIRCGVRRAIGSIAVLAPLVVGLQITTATAADAHRVTSLTAESHVSQLQQGLNFYKGKTVTLIAPDATGGGFDKTARGVAPFLSTYLGATINVENIPAGDTVAGQDALAAAAPDGLTVGMVDATVDVLAKLTGSGNVNFTPTHLPFLGGTGGSPVAFTCLASSPYKTFADVVKASQASPVTEVVSQSGTQFVDAQLINAAFGIKATEVTSYANTAAEVQGFERGDGQCSVLGLTNIGSFIAAGQAKILMLTSSYNPATADYSSSTSALLFNKASQQLAAKNKNERNARTALISFASKNPGHEFNLPAKTANDKVLAWQAAIEAALKNSSVEHTLLLLGQASGWVPGDRCRADYIALQKSLAPLKSLVA